MQIFVTGTDTNIGKTIVSAWLCRHFHYSYWKPIQSGIEEGSDSDIIRQLCNTYVYQEVYSFQKAASPHISSNLEGVHIDLSNIRKPHEQNLIIEGAGGVMTPLNKAEYIINLIAQLNVGVIIVASSRIGTINHTCLTINALKAYKIKILGVIMNGEINSDNRRAIEHYGKVDVLAELPLLPRIDSHHLDLYQPNTFFSSMMNEL